MLDQHRFGISSYIADLPDDNPDRATVGVGVDLKRLAPTSVEQCLRGCHTRLVRCAASGDPRQRRDGQSCVRTRQTSQIWCHFGHLALGCPSIEGLGYENMRASRMWRQGSPPRTPTAIGEVISNPAFGFWVNDIRPAHWGVDPV